MAKKGKFNYKQFFIVGVIWTAFYIGVVIRVLGVVLDVSVLAKKYNIFKTGFNFLSLDSYSKYFEAFGKREILIDSFETFLLFFFILFWIPIWLIVWWFLNKINWAKFKPKQKKSVVTKKVFELKENKPLYQMPRKMPSVVQATRYVAPKLPSQAEVVVSGNKSHTNLVQMIRAIAGLAKKYQVEIFQHILLEGNRVPMAISTDARAVLLEIVNKKNVNWSVEFTDDVTAGGWYSESGVMERLAQDLIGASAALARSEPNSEILSAIVITDGRILNTKQAVEYFRSKGIFLIGFNNAEPKNELPDLASFLSAYFDLKPGEQDPAPHPVEKVPIKSKSATAPIEEVTTNAVSENDNNSSVSDDASDYSDENDTVEVDVDEIDDDNPDDDVDVDVDTDNDVDDIDDDDSDDVDADDGYEENEDDVDDSDNQDSETLLNIEQEKVFKQQHRAMEQAIMIAKIRADAEARFQAKIAAQKQMDEQSRQQASDYFDTIAIAQAPTASQSASKIRAPMPINKPTEE